MAKKQIPVYDICSIDQGAQKDLLIERFAAYLEKHYHNLQRPHRHSFYHLVLFTGGKGSHTIDFERFPVRPFQVYFMRPGQVHSWHFEGGVDGFIMHFNENFISSFLQQGHYLEKFPFFSGDTSAGVCQLPVKEHHRVVNVFENMVTELNERNTDYLDMIRLQLLQLFVLVKRQGFQSARKNVPPQKLVLLRNYQQLIERYFRTIRLPKEYAELLYITPNHLNALCAELLGKTAGDLVRDRLLLEAKRLLTNADMTVTEIAYDLNFRDNSYFNRFFKKEAGLTPDEFRKQFVNN
jgi:AraC family transcriptional regulator, transcriptional activator of pobA